MTVLGSVQPAVAEAMAQGLFGDGVAVAATDPRAPETALWPEEAAAVASAVPKRRREFAAGRAAARRALAALGISAGPIPAGHGRAPVWPAGFVGSISHCDSLCLAAVSPVGTTRALGLDVEPDTELPDGLTETVCRPEERAWLSRQPQGLQGRLARLMFSAKEAAFKAQFPLTGTWLDFSDLVLSINPAAGRFGVRFTRRAGAFAPGMQLPGRHAIAGGMILTAVTVRC